MKKFLPLFAVIALAACRKDPKPQVMPPAFSHFYGTSNDEIGRQVKSLPDGSIVVGGYGVGSNGGNDFFLMKTDSTGNELWRRYYGSGGDENMWSFDVTPDGGFVIGGNSNSFGTGGYDFFIVKTDADGFVQWQKVYGGPLNENMTHIRALPNGFLCCGVLPTTNDENAFILRLDASGDSLWSFMYGGNGGDGAMSSCDGGNNRHVITGYTNSAVSGGTNGFLLLLNDNGEEITHYNFGTPEYDEPHSVIPAIDGDGWVITGHRGSAIDLTTHNVFVTAIGNDGTQRWNYSYGGDQHDGGECIVASGNSYGIVGRSSSHAGYSQDVYFTEIDRNGNQLQQQWLGTTADDAGYGIDGERYGFVMTGYASGGPFGGKDIFLARVLKK